MSTSTPLSANVDRSLSVASYCPHSTPRLPPVGCNSPARLCFLFVGVLCSCTRRDVVCSLVYSKHVKDMGLGIFLVQEHGLSKFGNRVKIQMPDADGQGGAMECTCNVPSRYRLPCQDVMAALTCELWAGLYPGACPCSSHCMTSPTILSPLHQHTLSCGDGVKSPLSNRSVFFLLNFLLAFFFPRRRALCSACGTWCFLLPLVGTLLFSLRCSWWKRPVDHGHYIGTTYYVERS